MKQLIAVLALSAVSLCGAGLVDPVNKNRGGVAIKGYDPVAYFDQSRPVKGSDKFTYQWMGATWRFASAASRDRFAASPERFAPQFGGYCAYAVSENYTADTDPEAWKIVDGKLYLNYNKKTRDLWVRDQARRIEAGHKNWPGLHK